MPRCEVPVSTTPRQAPSLQTSSSTPLMRTARMRICQYPRSAMATGAHFSSSSRRSSLKPPIAISLSSPSSPSVRKTPKWDRATLPLSMSMWYALNFLLIARPARPRPRIPSKWNVLKGCVDISTAKITLISMHRSSLAASASGPAPTPSSSEGSPFAATSDAAMSVEGRLKQTVSRANSPVISPVPKPMVTWSASSPSGTRLPLVLIGTAELDSVMLKRRWIRQASEWHSAAGRTMWPEPVSKTTRNSWAGVPTLRMPE
mmetsp:Transcript_2446/g.7257  ORF Transcript_2446/g.7257 Transcript_2446/m.7257 type:complete len:260 (-) Transcript_2446:490-1269(-)